MAKNDTIAANVSAGNRRVVMSAQRNVAGGTSCPYASAGGKGGRDVYAGDAKVLGEFVRYWNATTAAQIKDGVARTQ